MNNSKTLIAYVALWCLYNLQGIIYPTGSIVSQVTLAIYILISIYYFLYINYKYKLPLFINVLSVMILVMTLYGIFYMLFSPQYRFSDGNPVPKVEYFKSLYYSVLPIYAMYYFARKGILTEERIRRLSIVFIVISIFAYYHYYNSTYAMFASLGEEKEIFTNNTGYHFLKIMPLLFFWKKNISIQTFLLMIILLFIMMGMKRGAILISIICVFYLYYKSYSSLSVRQRNLLIISFIVLISFVSYYVVNELLESSYFNSRVEATMSGDSSGRDEMYAKLWNHIIYEDNIIYLLFGNGAVATVNLAGNYAHNDWLEIAINQGLFGVVLYILYFVALYTAIKRTKIMCRDCGNALTMVSIILFLTTVFSMSLTAIPLPMSVALGYALTMKKIDEEVSYNG